MDEFAAMLISAAIGYAFGFCIASFIAKMEYDIYIRDYIRRYDYAKAKKRKAQKRTSETG